MTTSTFTKEAREFATTIESSIVLVDGPTLSDLMIDHGVGVSRIAKHEVHKLDLDYFESDE